MQFVKYVIGILLLICISVSNAESSSLFNKHEYKELTADHRAIRVGDAITIVILESAQASASAGSADQTEFGVAAKASVNDKNFHYGLGVDSNSEGSASTQRRGLIKAQITAVVTAVDDNKNLVVQGQQVITIDGEEQKIELSGRVRRSDLASNNTIVSSRLFDAQIKFIGSGSVSDGKENGVFYKLFKWLGFR